MIKEIHSIHGDLCRKYRKLSEIVMVSFSFEVIFLGNTFVIF